MLKVYYLGNSKVEVRDVPVPGLKPGEVLVQVGASAICGSEMTSYQGPEAADGNGGHEIVGTVVDNPNGYGPESGARVAINIITGCGHCRYCLMGDRRFCDDQGYVMDGHAEYVATPAYTCMPLPDDIAFDLGVLLGGDTMGVAYHTFTKVKVGPKDTLAVVGAGPVGSGFIALLKYFGLRTFVAEISPYRQELARKIGADEVMDPTTTDFVAVVRELTGGKGVDVGIDASGKDAGVNLGLNVTRKEGRFVFGGAGHEATIHPWRQFLEKEVTGYGVWYFTDEDYFGILDAYRDGLLVNSLLTHRFHLKDASEAYELFAAGKSGKVVFMP